MTAISLQTQLQCAQRELRFRHSVYPRRVAQRKMSFAQSQDELAAMAAIVCTLSNLCTTVEPASQQDMFAPSQQETTP